MRTSKLLYCCCSIDLQALQIDIVENLFLSDNYRKFSVPPQKLEEVYNLRDYRAEVVESNEPVGFSFSRCGAEL